MIERNDSEFADKIDTAEVDEAARLLCDKYGRKYCVIPTQILIKLLHITGAAPAMPARDGFGLTFSKALRAAGFSSDEVIAAVKELD